MQRFFVTRRLPRIAVCRSAFSTFNTERALPQPHRHEPPFEHHLFGIMPLTQPRHQLLLAYDQLIGLLQFLPSESMYRQSIEKIAIPAREIVRHHVPDSDATEETSLALAFALDALENESSTEKGLPRVTLAERHQEILDEVSLCQKMTEWEPWHSVETVPEKDQWKYPWTPQ